MSGPPARVLAIAGDAGGAEAVAPVLFALRRSGVSVTALAYRQAIAVWEAHGLGPQPATETWRDAEMAALLDRERPALVLTGTSCNGVDLEVHLLRAAIARGIPTLSVLDMWSSYSKRFHAVHGQGDAVPDQIAVMDSRARDEMLRDGFEPRRVLVTGHPAFDALLATARAFTTEQREALRSAIGIQPNDALILFASQPLADAWGADTTAPGHPGYTETTVLEALLPSLARVAPSIAQRIRLVIRPHPREAAVQPPSHPGIDIQVSRAGRPREAMLAADVVLGMCTVMLVENALLGRPTVSLQPGLRQPDALPTGVHPASRSIYRASEIDDALHAAFDWMNRGESTPIPAGDATDASATLRVATLARTMIGSRG